MNQDPFESYKEELDSRDLAPATRERYWHIVESYQNWLNGKEPDPKNARDFITHLRNKNYQPSSVLLYYHAIRLFFEFQNILFKLKLRKPHHLPQYYSRNDIYKLINQAKIGLRGQNHWHREVRHIDSNAVLYGHEEK